MRTLLNHMVFESLAHAALATGGPMPGPDAGTDYLGDDHVAAFRASAERAHAALTDPALLHRTFGPLEAPGAFVARMLVNEHLTHGWDLARATGQHTDVAPATVERALPAARAFYGDVPRTATTYRSEQPVPADATAADRLAERGLDPSFFAGYGHPPSQPNTFVHRVIQTMSWAAEEEDWIDFEQAPHISEDLRVRARSWLPKLLAYVERMPEHLQELRTLLQNP